MTDQRQNTRNYPPPPVSTLAQAHPDRAGPASSTQDSTAADRADSDYPTETGTVYESTGYESALDESVVDEPRVDATVADRPGVDENIAEQPVADGEGPGGVKRSDPEDDASVNRANEHAVGVASVPEPEPKAGGVDRGEFDSPSVATQDAVESHGPDGVYSIDAHGAEAATAVEDPNATEEPVGAAAGSEAGRPLDDTDERAGVVGGGAPMVAVAEDEAPAPDGTGQLLPCDVPDEPDVALLDDEMTERFRGRWERLQMSFVDDPKTAAGLAGALVDEAVTALRDGVDRQRSALEEWQSGHGVDAHSGDTERLRVAVRRYRDFLNRLLRM
jgi:hypothetical protein